jgi:hypothetical protein
MPLHDILTQWHIFVRDTMITQNCCAFYHPKSTTMAQEDIIFNENEFNTQMLTCSNCGWSGTGSETKVIDFYGLTEAKQVNCPACDNNLGSLVKGDGPPGGINDELANQIG